MLYFLIILGIIVPILTLRSYIKINKLSEEGTQLVAFTKNAIIEERIFAEEDTVEKQFERLAEACYLFCRFVSKTKDMRRNYNFSVLENGPIYGTIIDVQIGPFTETIKNALMKRANSFPSEYQKRINSYLQNPNSEESKKMSEEAELYLFSKGIESDYLKRLSDDYRKGIIDTDYMFTILN